MFQKFDGRSRKTIFTILYWSVAVIVLIGIIYFVLRATAPEKIPTQTPDITATIQKALADALGPPSGTPTITQPLPPSETPDPTRTPLPSPTPTISLTPTITPTPTSTQGYPTFTPVLPQNVNEAYGLVDLSPAQYEYAIALIEGVPDLLPEETKNDNYYASFYHAVVLESAAIQRYPTDDRSEGWRWGLAYNLARIEDEKSTILYASYLSNEINTSQISIDDLPAWVERKDPRLSLNVIEVTPIKENVENYLLELKTEGGSIFTWLVETSDAKTVYPLSDETNFANPFLPKISWEDLNNDGTDDLIIFTPTSDSRFFSFPTIFDLTHSPPAALPFKPDQVFEVGLENEYEWKAISNNQGFSDLEIKSVVYPPCPVTIKHTYQWNGGWFVRIEENYKVQPVTQLLEFCELLVNQASNIWNLPAAIQIMEDLLPEWPPKTTSIKTYPLDAKDEWLYRLGVYHALVGNKQNAEMYFEEIIQTPAAPNSRWVKPADDFKSDFDTPEGLYNSCIDSEFCDPRTALMEWVSTIEPEEAVNTQYYLTWGGVSIRYTNKFDFEGDGKSERWFIIRHRETDRLEFWIESITDSGAQYLFVDTVDTSAPMLTRYTNLDGQTYVWIGSQQSFSLIRYPGEREASVHLLPPSYYYAELTNQLAKGSINSLLSGFSPEIIREQLADHLDTTTFVCLNKEDCARFYFALGLAAELSGDEELAVDSYMKIWWDSFESPFSTIVRMKLTFKPGYGPLPSPTITQTPSRTQRPTISPTPTRTPRATESLTPTPTITFTEDPNMTYTPTPSVSPTPTATETTDPYP